MTGRTRRCRAMLAALLTTVVVLSGCGTGGSGGGGADPPSPARRSSASARPSPSATPSRPAPQRVMFGAYLDLSGHTHEQAEALRRRQLGRSYRIDQEFFAWKDSLLVGSPAPDPGQLLMVSWRGTYYRQILDGSQDTWIAEQADRLKRYGKPVLLRWGWEMNGDWFVWGGAANGKNPAGFVAAWRHLHAIFAKQGATNVQWVWGPNRNSNPDARWNDVRRYYPGDRYVDWIAVSGYSYGTKSPAQLFDRVYNLGTDKPFMLAETGVRADGKFAAHWVGQLRRWVARHPRTRAVIWFDTDTSQSTALSWRIDATPQLLAAVKAMGADPRFQG
ncbi:glycosyl hydrolase [Actinocatenispora sera]|uniref:glycoside hydrolase family 26 protein n=1 Tax=Actinocatenispora sera TaxID=390989 RepID=UPI0033D5E5A0